MRLRLWLVPAGLALFGQSPAHGDREARIARRQEASDRYPDLALKLENPLARILALPVAVRYEDGLGAAGDGSRDSLRMTPRVPIVLNDDWHLICQSEITWLSQRKVSGTGNEDGLGDLTMSFLFSPERSLAWNTYWGLGPGLVLPTATNDLLGSRQFSAGPVRAFFRQSDRWTAGLLCGHVWSVAGASDAAGVSLTRIEPLIAYTTPTSTTLTLAMDARYNWHQETWQAPVLLSLSQLTIWGERPVKVALGFEWDPVNNSTGAEWGVQLKFTLTLDPPRWRRAPTGG